MRRLLALIALGLALLVAVPLIAQDQMSPEEQKDWFTQFVEGQLSTPERQIRISNIDGVLSQDASIREITISDGEGVWLRIDNAAINWDQGALLTGRLLVHKLSAESIEYLRNPVPTEGVDLPPPEAGEFEVPDFPVAIILEELSVPRVTFGTSVFGLGSEIGVTGSFKLENGSLDTALAINRLDGPGGGLALKVAYQKAEDSLDVGVKLTEPPDGILVNLLGVEGRPEIALSVSGSGPVADLRTEMALDAGGKRALSGLATITQQTGGFAVSADLHGPIADLVAPAYRPFFGAETALRADAVVQSAGGVTLSKLDLGGGQLALTAAAETTADGFLSALKMHASVADAAGGPVLLPVAGAETSVQSAVLDVDFGGAGDDAWSAKLDIGGFANGMLAAKSLALTAGGVASNLTDAASRRVTFNADGMLSGIVADEPDTQAALGDAIGIGIAGLFEAGKPLQIAELRLEGKALEAVLAGRVDDYVFDGGVSLKTASLAPFSGLAGRDLSGALAFSAKGTVSPLSGGFNLTLDGTAQNLAVDEPALDPVLRGEVRLGGRVARTSEGLEAEGFRIANPQVTIAAGGRYATGAADFRFSLDLADLGLVSPNAGGALSIVGTAKGEGPVALELAARVAEGTLAGRRLSGAAFGFSGSLDDAAVLTGALTGSASLDGYAVSLAGDVRADDQERRLSGLRFVAGPTELTGDVRQGANGLLTGGLKLASPNVSVAAALLMTHATGAANADIALAAQGDMQGATVSATIRDFDAAGIAVIGSADIKAKVSDLFGVPQVDGTVAGRAITAGGLTIARLDARASRSAEATSFTADASLDNGAALSVAGSLAPLADGFALGLERATLTQKQTLARLAQPVTLRISGDSVALDAVRFDVGSGHVTASGSAGQALDIAVDIVSVPLSVANAIQPGLGLGGAISGKARVSGTAAAPQAAFTLAGSGITAAAIASYGVAPLGFSAEGSFADDTIRIGTLRGEGAGGLSFTGSGTAPLAGRGLAVAVEGSAPLALGNRFVASRGGQLSGTARFAVDVTGSIADPKVAGSVSLSGGGYVDPALNLRLVEIAGTASLSAERITIERLTAGLSTGGSVSASGSIGLGAGMPADLALRLDSARYADGTLLVATVSGQLAVTGPLLANPLLAGRVDIEKADISVPEQLGGSATLIDVKHLDAPAPVTRTLARATVDASGAPIPQSRASALQLDVAVDAPNQIYVRGRGLDVEVGGSVRLTGPISDIRPVGGFELRRGRLSILGQRINFSRGSVSLVGDLDPFLNLVAETQGEGITAYVTVSGRVSDVQVDFTSSPALPQDEVLSRLLFKRSMGELSPLQLARLAGAAAELAGGGGNSLVDLLRAKAGLDNLDVTTDEKGNVAVQAGAYVQDNIYLGVQAGADGNSRVTVNLDITDDIKAKASTGVDGASSLGIFYEGDY